MHAARKRHEGAPALALVLFLRGAARGMAQPGDRMWRTPQRDRVSMRVLRAALCVSILSPAVSLDWRPGYCDVTGTRQGVRCSPSDTKGSWKSNTKRECIDRCAQCTQCAFISWTRTDCSWFSHCDMFALNNERSTSHKTLPG